MKPLPLALTIVCAMLAGAGITYWTIQRAQQPAPARVVSNPPQIAPTNTEPVAQKAATPSATTPDQKPETAGIALEQPAFDEQALEAAITAAKEARARGELQPVAKTPEEYARALGAFNYRLAELARDFPNGRPDGTPEAKAYDGRTEQLTKEYANLSLDESLLEEAKDDTAAELAHFQAHLAGGSLDLDAAGIAKLGSMLRQAYEPLLPLDPEDPESEAKLDRMTAQVSADFTPTLTEEQKKRLDVIGLEQALFGLIDLESEP